MGVVTSKGPASEAVQPRRGSPAGLCSRSAAGLGASPAENLRYCRQAGGRQTAVGKLSGGNRLNSTHAAPAKSERALGFSTVKPALRDTKKSGIGL